MRLTPLTVPLLVVALLVPLWPGEFAVAQEDEAEVDIVARVGEDAVVTRREFDRSLKAMSRGNAANVPHEQQLELLNNIVDVKVQYVLATKSGVKVTDAELDADIAKRTSRMTPEQFAAGLKRSGITEDEFKYLIREQMTVAKYRQNQSESVGTVTEADVAAEYENLNKDGQFDRVDVSHILIMVQNTSDEAAWTEAKTRIDDAHERVTTGQEDFAKVAREVTEDPGSKQSGGAYPNTPRGKMVPEFEEAMFATPVGEVSKPFRTAYGWHIVTPTARRSVPLEDVAGQIQVYVTERRINEHVQKLVAEAKAEMEIEIRLDAGTAAPAS